MNSFLERVRYFRSDLVTWVDDKTQAIPDGCIGRGMELRRSVSDLDDRRRTATSIRPARNVQRVALDGASRRAMAHAAAQLPAVGTAAQAARDEGIELQVIKLPEAKKGFVLLPRRWVVERSFGWLNRFRRLARDYERLPETLAGLHFVVFAMLMLVHAVPIIQST